MKRGLTKIQLHQLLYAQEHSFISDDLDAIDIWPDPTKIITIALEPDETLRKASRNRFFACVIDEEEDPCLFRDQRFILPDNFKKIAGDESAHCYFLRGPFRWLLPSLCQFQNILFWPEKGFCGADGMDFFIDMPPKNGSIKPLIWQMWLEQHKGERSELGAVLLNLSDVHDCQVVWEAAKLVGENNYNFYLSDESAQEIYLLHHHDKIVISIPDDTRRYSLLRELQALDDVLEDCSGYISEWDEEFEP